MVEILPLPIQFKEQGQPPQVLRSLDLKLILPQVIAHNLSMLAYRISCTALQLVVAKAVDMIRINHML